MLAPMTDIPERSALTRTLVSSTAASPMNPARSDSMTGPGVSPQAATCATRARTKPTTPSEAARSPPSSRLVGAIFDTLRSQAWKGSGRDHHVRRGNGAHHWLPLARAQYPHTLGQHRRDPSFLHNTVVRAAPDTMRVTRPVRRAGRANRPPVIRTPRPGPAPARYGPISPGRMSVPGGGR